MKLPKPLLLTTIISLAALTLHAQQYPWVNYGTHIYYNAGNVGIGISNPAANLTVASSNPVLKLVHNDGRTIGNTIACEFAVDGPSQNGLGGFSLTNMGGANGVHDYRIYLWDGRAGTPERLRIEGWTGNVGIGTSTPSQLLDVNGNIKANGFILPTGATAGAVLTSDANGNATWQTTTGSFGWSMNGSTVGAVKSIGTLDDFDLPVITNSSEKMRIMASGGVAIGTTSLPAADAKLAVKGVIYSTKVRVTPTGWADYVFYSNYKLRPLSEVEHYIQKYHHLPEVPSALEVEKKGLDVGDNQVLLLKKIEELTLYIIEQNKKLEDKNAEVNHLQQSLQSILQRLDKLEKTSKK